MEVISEVSIKERIYWKDSNKQRSAIVNKIRFPRIQDLDTQILIGNFSYFVSRSVQSSTINWNGGAVRDNDLINTNKNNSMVLNSVYDIKNKVFYLLNNKVCIGYVSSIQFPSVRLVDGKSKIINECKYNLRPTPKGATDFKTSICETELFKSKKDLLKSM